MVLTHQSRAAFLVAALIATTLPAHAADPLAPSPAFDAHSFGGRVAHAADGRQVVVWEDGRTILAQRYDANATPIGAALRVPDAEGTNPRVAMNATGGFVVIWQSGNDAEVRAHRFSPDGTAEGAEVAVSGSQAHILDAAVDMDAAGAFVVVWDQYESRTTGNGMSCMKGYGDCVYLRGNAVRARRFGADGSAVGEAHLVDGNSIVTVSIGQTALGAGDGAAGPDVTLRADGSYVVGWTRVAVGPPGTISGVFIRTITARDDRLPQVLVKYLEAGYPAFSMSLDSDAAGNVVVAYSQQVTREPAYGVFEERFAAHGQRLGGMRLDNGTRAIAGAPEVRVQPAGGTVALWQSAPASTAGGSRTWTARHITADGRSLPGAYAMLSATATGQVAQVTGNASGSLAVNWQSPWRNGASAHLVAGP